MSDSGRWFSPPRIEQLWTEAGSTTHLAEALAAFGARRVAVVAPRSVAGSDWFDALVRSLAPAATLVVSDEFAHVPSTTLDCTYARVCRFDPDCILTVGGGSATDFGKALRLMLATGAATYAGIRCYLQDEAPPVDVDTRPFVLCVPTTLAAAEFTPTFTVTHDAVKEMFRHQGLAPRAVFIDACVSRWTPPRLWRGTGMRAVDHCVEGYLSRAALPLTDALALHALALLLRHLPPPSGSRVEERQLLHHAAWLSAFGALETRGGVSHAIGHQLGAATGMAHGETSAVMLAHALRFNEPMSASRQTELLELVRAEAPALARETLADTVEALVRTLGLASRLRDAGVNREQLERVARATMTEPALATNPRPVELDDVWALLERAF